MSVDGARRLRRESSHAERKLWRYLRNRQMAGRKFQRQHPLGPFIVDFCCEEARLVVELDGGQHGPLSADAQRTEPLNALGYRVIRFWNNDALKETEAVLETIHAALALPS